MMITRHRQTFWSFSGEVMGVMFCLFCVHCVCADNPVPCYEVCECNLPTVTCNITTGSTFPQLAPTDSYTKIYIFGNRAISNIPDNVFPSSWRVTDFEIHHTNISDLYCTALDPLISSLTTFGLLDNTFRVIPRCLIGRLSRLKRLVIQGNPIDVLANGDLFSNPDLTELDFRRNTIEGIHPQALKSMSKLKKLILRENKLGSLSDGQFESLGNPTLDLLDLSHNYIAVLSEGMLRGIAPNLRQIDISYNRITATTWSATITTLSSLQNLQSLIISGNKIQNIESQQLNNTFPQFHTLGLAECSLGNVPWEVVKTIANLNVSGNGLVSNELAFYRSKEICPSSESDCSQVSITLSDNHISALEVTREFTTASKPFVLTAERNTLRKVSVYLNNVPTSASSKRPILGLNLTGNQMSVSVQLFLNPVPLPGTYKYSQQVNLDLSDNNLAHLDTPPLRVFIAPLTNLSSAEEIPTCSLLTTKIDLSVLDLSGNQIESIPAESCLIAQVEMLRINRNKITSLRRLALTDHPNGYNRLRVIEVRDNAISTVAIDTFLGLTKLSVVDLRGNSLLTLPDLSYITSFSDFKSLHLDDNPLNCNCDLAWIPGESEFYTSGTMTGRCALPPNLDGYNPVCQYIGSHTCPGMSPIDLSDSVWQQRFQVCDSDPFVEIKDFSANIRRPTQIGVTWTKTGPGSVSGYNLTYGIHGPSKTAVLVHPGARNFTIHDLTPGFSYEVCMTALMLREVINRPALCINSTTLPAQAEDASTIIGLGVALGVLLLLFVLTIAAFVLYRVRNMHASKMSTSESPREDYEIAKQTTPDTSSQQPPNLPDYIQPSSRQRHPDAAVHQGRESVGDSDEQEIYHIPKY